MSSPRPGAYATRFGFSAAEIDLWCWIRDQGGYWCAAEVAPHTSIASGASIGGSLKRMWTAGHLTRRVEPTWKGYVYGVTRSCVPPKGQTLTPTQPTPKASQP